MITRELIKKEIDKLPEAELEKIYLLIQSKAKELPIKLKTTSKIKGRLDKANIRKLAYEK